jgi:hypothetical protein
LIQKLDNNELSLAPGETIKIIGHSQGAAFAAGLATALANSQKYSSLVEVVHYISPHQPQAFTHPRGIPAHEWSTFKDDLSSRNNFFSFLKGKSYFSLIDGVPRGNWHKRGDFNGGYHGHLVGTWLYDMARYFYNLGIPVKIDGAPYIPPEKLPTIELNQPNLNNSRSLAPNPGFQPPANPNQKRGF